ncbi:MAG: Rrf2 family transcriptional regulator [Planctomycetota bacterium]
MTMRLTGHTDYALRVLLYLGAHPGEWAISPDIARAFDISFNHLSKVVNRLGHEGLVEVKRGRGGGICLGLQPKDIIIGDVVRRFEGPLALVECQEESGDCVIAKACTLNSVLADAGRAFFSVLDGVSLEDLLDGRRSALRRLLS